MEIPEPSPSPSEESDSDENGTSYRYYLQLATSLVTLVVAVSAIGLSVWEGLEMRRHNRLSVLPHLDISIKQLRMDEGEQVTIGGTQETLTEPSYVFRAGIENTGLGPAVFKQALLFRAGADSTLYATKKDGDYVNLYRADSLVAELLDTFPEAGSFVGEIGQGTMMKAGASQPFLEMTIPETSVPDTADVFPPRRVLELLHGYSFVVCYCSVYGENCDEAHIGASPPAEACSY